MPTIFLIISIYIAINLALLVFKPMREYWKVWFEVCKEFLEENIWTKVFVLPGMKLPWWKIILYAVAYVFFMVSMLCVIMLCTILPIYVYRNAFFSYKIQKNDPEWHTKQIPPWTEWGANTEQNSIVFDTEIPFTPCVYDVIYVEDQYNPIINEYIQVHYEELCSLFLSKNLIFNYLPKICKQKVPEDVLHYMCPFVNQDDTIESDEITLNTLSHHLTSGSFVSPALIHYKHNGKDSQEQYCFTYRPLVPKSKVPLADQFKWYVNHVSFTTGGDILAHVDTSPHEDEADIWFNNNTQYNLFFDKSDVALIEEIRTRVMELRKRGVQLHLIQKLIEEQPTLSHLVIDKDFRIILPEYNNMEITMSPLPKAVYLLFLRHPEGIPFKQLRDYYFELLDIYKQISNRMVEDNIEQSIRDITDPTKNSINEKCTRIREAFVSKFDNLYAQYYYITGKRGEPKMITLPRELVDLQGL